MFHRPAASGAGLELCLDEFHDAREVLTAVCDEYAAGESSDYVRLGGGRGGTGGQGRGAGARRGFDRVKSEGTNTRAQWSGG